MKVRRTAGDMLPQDYCALPWCGQSFGAPHKRIQIDGEVWEYPELIDGHHSGGRKRPPIVYICHACHMAHHDGRRRLEIVHNEYENQLLVRTGSSLAPGEDRWLPLHCEHEVLRGEVSA